MALKPANVQWSEDGTLTSLDFGDVYFQRKRGLGESRYVFIEKNRLEERLTAQKNGSFHIAELGFGTGLNFLLTAELFSKIAKPDARLVYVSIEKHPIRKEELERIHAYFAELAPFSAALQQQYPPLIEGFHRLSFLNGRISLLLAFGDVAEVLPQMSGTFDCWYLDGFMPAKNPGMWGDDLYRLIYERTKQGGTLSTFSAVGDLRRGLKACGFEVKREKGYAYKYHMTVAKKPAVDEETAPHTKRALVAGAGIAGCSVAYALALRGYAVTIVDRFPRAAASTSGNPVGIVYPKLTVDTSPLGMYHSHAFCFTRNLLQNIGLPSWRPCGVLHLDMNDEDRQRTKNLVERQQYPEDFVQRVQEGLFQPTAGYLSPPEFCNRLLQHPNITPVFESEMEDYFHDFINDTVIIAQGFDSTMHAETTWMPLETLRGQMSYLKETKASANLKMVVCHDGYITPSVSGMHYIGATFSKEQPSSPVLREEDHDENVGKLCKALPQFGFRREDVTGGRTGYRTATPDKLPMIGPCPDYDAFMKRENAYLPNLYVTTGFGAHGMTGAPLAGEILACLIAGEPLPVPQALYDHLKPERFILRDIKRKKI